MVATMNFNISDGQIFTQSGLSSNYRTRTIEVESILLSGSQLPRFQTDLYLNLLIFFTDHPKASLWLTYKKSSTCIYKARFLFTRFNCIWHTQVFPATHLISAFTHSLGPTHANEEKNIIAYIKLHIYQAYIFQGVKIQGAELVLILPPGHSHACEDLTGGTPNLCPLTEFAFQCNSLSSSLQLVPSTRQDGVNVGHAETQKRSDQKVWLVQRPRDKQQWNKHSI